VTRVEQTFNLTADAERTIECNPGTVTPASLRHMRRLGFNRISLGVQSFHDHHLSNLGRIHNASEALDAYRMAGEAGFANRSIDLMFGLPGQTLEEWKTDLRRAVDLGPEHLSLYSLTVEKGTEFGMRSARGELPLPDEDLSADMYELAIDTAAEAGFEQYEVSSFARPGFRSRHNSIYWTNDPYVGFGVSAASYCRGVRWTNIAAIERYRLTVQRGECPVESEERLDPAAAAAEAAMLGLRTADGICLGDLSQKYGVDAAKQFSEQVERLSKLGLLEQKGGRVHLTRRGLLLANGVCAEFLT